jgi:hypothetical protein
MEDNVKDIPFYAYEYTMASFERTIKRLVVALILTIVFLFATNVIWLYEWNQYDYADVTVDSQDGGNANYLNAGANGAIRNVEGDSQRENKEE